MTRFPDTSPCARGEVGRRPGEGLTALSRPSPRWRRPPRGSSAATRAPSPAPWPSSASRTSSRPKAHRLLRHTLSTDEVADAVAFFRAQSLAGLSDGTREGFRQGLASLLLHSDFLFVRDAPAGQTQRLDAFSLASRLSFALTGHGPDDTLFAAAADGSLLEQATLDAEVTRLLATTEAKARTRAFYRQWLRYDGWSVAYSAAFLEGIDASRLEQEATAELDTFLERHLAGGRDRFGRLALTLDCAPHPGRAARVGDC